MSEEVKNGIIDNGYKVEHWKDGKLHRLDGPAVFYKNSDKGEMWYKEGQYHRIGGPAIVWHDGDFSWYKDGKYHREDGPAQDWNNSKNWYINGILANGIGRGSKTHLKLLIDYKYSLKFKKNVLEYQNDDEERKKLERLT